MAPAILRALLAKLIDYAGLFPPASLSMPDTVRNYSAYRQSADAWALGRLVVPAARLAELGTVAHQLSVLEQKPWHVSVIAGDHFDADITAIRAFNADDRPHLRVDAVEVRANSVDDVHRIALYADSALATFVEVPSSTDPRSMLDALQGHHLWAKIRTGGTTSDAFPQASAVARFLIACFERDLRFKATAGLHHPTRGEYPLTYAGDAPRGEMFGFLNLFIAAALARTGADEAEVSSALEERNAGAFTFSKDAVTAFGSRLDVDDITTMRAHGAISFGSCSFREPIDELTALGLLPQ